MTTDETNAGWKGWPDDAERATRPTRVSQEEALGVFPYPVMQTAFGEPDGNCLEACIAALTGIPLEEIPHFVDDDWYGDYRLWLFERGWHLVWWNAGTIEAPLGLAIANGPSPRGLPHSVIYRDGAMVHDPHPDQSGILNVEYWLIVDITEAAALRDHIAGAGACGHGQLLAYLERALATMAAHWDWMAQRPEWELVQSELARAPSPTCAPGCRCDALEALLREAVATSTYQRPHRWEEPEENHPGVCGYCWRPAEHECHWPTRAGAALTDAAGRG